MMRIGLVRGLVALLLLPGISHALGLGDVHLNSPLNAPLDAEIELVNATPEDLATLDAKLATKETFARYGLDWPPFMASVTVTRDRAANGAQVLRIKSTETVTEPFLTLLIEATWARGRLVREYTVLLDPPVFAPNSVAAAPVPAPAVSQRQAAGQISRPAPEAAAPSAMPQAPAGGGDSYEVQRGDSLSAIARRLSASSGQRTDQLMVSIYRGNSGAFEGDMNRLRAGSVLRIPGGDEVAAVSPSEARDEIRRSVGSYAASSGRPAAPVVCAWFRPASRPPARAPAATIPPKFRSCRAAYATSKVSSTNPSACSSCAIPSSPICRPSWPLLSSSARRATGPDTRAGRDACRNA